MICGPRKYAESWEKLQPCSWKGKRRVYYEIGSMKASARLLTLDFLSDYWGEKKSSEPVAMASATKLKKKHLKAVHQKVKLFRAKDPLLSVLMWGINHSVSVFINTLVQIFSYAHILYCCCAVYMRHVDTCFPCYQWQVHEHPRLQECMMSSCIDYYSAECKSCTINSFLTFVYWTLVWDWGWIAGE